MMRRDWVTDHAARVKHFETPGMGI
ncbi:hypothetical protein SBA6_810001 [Candidatus Sulfopaludibacter sp. SbA6]|nr:hypothetical protein SBA6_810001 [Candidatus Sulfopaludibacter sp. SbA6]